MFHFECLAIEDWCETINTADIIQFTFSGNVFVISGNLQYFAGKQCNSSRYQPHKWWTNGSSDCQYLKSTCNGEGQIPYDNGTITKDRKCRCDYTNYFTFGSSTINKCHCDPIVEDCSCYSKRCYENQVLTPGNYSRHFHYDFLP